MASAAWTLLVTGLACALASARGYEFIGCFRDNEPRDLLYLAGKGAMTPARCNQLCTGKRFAYFGLQAGEECYCGNGFGKYGEVPVELCEHDCSGDPSKKCGSHWKNSLYSTDAERGFRYIGCFADAKERDLPLMAAKQGDMTPAKCNQLCTGRRFPYFGVQAANECFCGNGFGKYGVKPMQECDHDCTGDRGQKCGGGMRNSLYTTDFDIGIQYLGCYVDYVNKIRDLPLLMISGEVKISKCHDLCKKENFPYFSVQNGDECWCGMSYGRFGPRSIEECDKKCTGDPTELCGGVSRNIVYANTGVEPFRV